MNEKIEALRLLEELRQGTRLIENWAPPSSTTCLWRR